MSAPEYESLQSAFDAFEAICIPKTAGDHQRRMMRDAFYAGALVSFNLLTAGVDELTEEQAMQRFKSVKEEFDIFALTLKTTLSPMQKKS